MQLPIPLGQDRSMPVTSKRTSVFNAWSFGVNGVLDDVAIQGAIDAARQVGGEVEIDPGRYLLSKPLNLTFSATDVASVRQAISIRSRTDTSFGTGTDISSATLVATHTGHVIDCAGSYHLVFQNINVGTLQGVTAKSAWFLARNTLGSNGGAHTFINCRAYGQFANATVYSYGSEVNAYRDCHFANTAPNPVVVKWTSGNIDALTSSFIPIANGNQSNIITFISGGEFIAGGAGGKVFYLDQHDFVSIKGVWCMCADAANGGHSIVYVDQTIGTSNNLTLEDITSEHSAFLPSYGVFYTNNVQTPVYHEFKRVRFATSLNPINAGASVRALLFHIEDCTDFNGNHATFGTLDTSYVKALGLHFDIVAERFCEIHGDPTYFSYSNTPVGGLHIWTSTSSGIGFPAAQLQSNDPNVLDDYEEGDWTPVLGGTGGQSGQTYSNQVGTYTKIGRTVHCTFCVSLSVPGAVVGNAVISGLPFPVAAGVKNRVGAAIGFADALGVAIVSIHGWADAGASMIQLYHRAAAAVGETQSPNTLIQSGAAPFLIGEITYQTNT